MSMRDFQAEVWDWMMRCFSDRTARSRRERAFRMLEEALELFQSLDCDVEDALRLVQYVYGRPVGVPEQEVGGLMMTLAALCGAAEVDLQKAAYNELWRVNTPEVLEKIRAKRAARVVPSAD